MINNLKNYIANGLIYSKSSNTAIKRLAADTCHEFIEWLGLIEGTTASDFIVFDTRLWKDELYMDFVSDNPDFAVGGKRTISRTSFYKWLKYYGEFNNNIKYEEGRSNQGRWVIYKTSNYEEKEDSQEVIPGLEF